MSSQNRDTGEANPLAADSTDVVDVIVLADLFLQRLIEALTNMSARAPGDVTSDEGDLAAERGVENSMANRSAADVSVHPHARVVYDNHICITMWYDHAIQEFLATLGCSRTRKASGVEIP